MIGKKTSTEAICCITGGCGFLGLQLAQDLVDNNSTHHYRPILLDVAPPPCDAFEYIMVDVRDRERLTEIFRTRGVHAVFHIASYGMSGSSQLKRDMVRSINVDGTQSVIDACTAAGVGYLISTSTYNVVFGGYPIEGGDESMPYFNLFHHVDEYSRSKTEAEMMVLEAHRTPLRCRLHHHTTTTTILDGDNSTQSTTPPHGGVLNTCALRPAAIWGKGEMRHMQRVYSYLMRGLFFFRFGSKDARMDFVHVKNLSKAHILALERLERASSQNTKTVLSSTSSLQGQAYFISDGEEERIHNFDFFSQLPVGLGYRKPFLTIPFHLMYLLAFLFEILYSLWPHFEPLLTRAEVLKAGVSHWFRIDKARQELGYQPSKFRFDEVLEQFRSETDHRQEKKHS
ncbi:hypothetical protein M9434_006488 [Picochlorum sp. BPE23]|nr:hypothetical protein M9434_006488 [Picochlorum sp. BPE23]